MSNCLQLRLKLGAARLLLVAAVLLVAALVSANEADRRDERPSEFEEFHPTLRFDPGSYSNSWLASDRDGDGIPDYFVQVDERGYKLREAMDFNYDGRLDDFYFYSNDVLQRQELDSNFDDRIDIWIYMWRGVYVRKWERDTDFDGEIDLVREYGQTE